MELREMLAEIQSQIILSIPLSLSYLGPVPSFLP